METPFFYKASLLNLSFFLLYVTTILHILLFCTVKTKDYIFWGLISRYFDKFEKKKDFVCPQSGSCAVGDFHCPEITICSWPALRTCERFFFKKKLCIGIQVFDNYIFQTEGGFPFKIKTKIRHHIICCYHNFIM